MRRLVLAALSLLLATLSGCADLIDTDQRRLCRSLLPALEPAYDGFDVLRTDELTGRAVDGVVVRLTYRARDGAATGQRAAARVPVVATLTCSFAPNMSGKSSELVSVAGRGGVLGPVRLHVLQRYWIDAGLATRADPAPILMLPVAPTLPRALAIALQTALSSLPVIAIYALLATSYALVYGLVGRINLAFGDLASIAGYGAFLGFSMLGEQVLALAVAAALVVGLLTAAMHGGALGRLVVAPLAAAPGQHILIATIGISIFWQEGMRLTQGSGTRWLSPLLNRPVGLARADGFTVTVTPMAAILAATAAAIATLLVVAMHRSRFGLRWRACADDPTAAAMLGVDERAMLLTTMIVAALMAGCGGVLTTFYYGGVGYSGGLVIGLKALIAAVVGGIGSIKGALAGAVVVGVIEAIWSGLFPIELRDPALFVGLVAMLWLKPTGFYGLAQEPATRRL